MKGGAHSCLQELTIQLVDKPYLLQYSLMSYVQDYLDVTIYVLKLDTIANLRIKRF